MSRHEHDCPDCGYGGRGHRVGCPRLSGSGDHDTRTLADVAEALAARVAALETFANWCASLDQFDGVTIAFVRERAREALERLT